LAACIAMKILSSWRANLAQQQKQQAKKKGNGGSANMPSTRLLAPLLLLTEYFFHSKCGEFDQSQIIADEEVTAIGEREERRRQQEQHDHVRKEFWKTTALIWNLAKQQFKVSTVEVEEDCKSSVTLPDAYENLVGFLPFSSFISPMAENSSVDMNDDEEKTTNINALQNGFVSNEQATALFETSGFVASLSLSSTALSMTQQTQRPATQQTQTQPSQQHGEGANVHHNNSGKSNSQLVIRRLLFVAKKIADSSEPKWVQHVSYNADDDMLEWKETIGVGEEKEEVPAGNAGAMDIDDDEGESFVPPSDDDDAGDEVLIYQEGAPGATALLVPGSMVPHSEDPENKSSPTAVDTPMDTTNMAANVEAAKDNVIQGARDVDVEMDHIRPSGKSQTANTANGTTGSQPSAPPGFGPPPGFGGNMPPAPLPRLNANTMLSTIGNFFPAQQQQPSVSLFDADSSATVGPSIGEAYGALPLPPTENPFANNTMSHTGITTAHATRTSPTAPPYALSFLQPQTSTANNQEEGVSLLNSGLLESLWMDDSTKPKQQATIGGAASSMTNNPFAF